MKDFPHISSDNIGLLIRYNKGNYIVFLDSMFEFDWATTDNYDNRHEGCSRKRDRMLSQIEYLQHEPAVRYLKRKVREDFFTMLAETWVYALNEHFDLAESHLKKCKKYLRDRNFEVSRRWQIEYTLLLAVLFTCGFVLLLSNVDFLAQKFQITKAVVEEFCYIIFGAWGAMFSIFCKTGKSECNCQSGRVLNVLEVLCRMIASMVSAFIAMKMFALDLAFSAFKTKDYLNIALTLICFISGFSERLVPSLISKLTDVEMEDNHD